MTHNFDPLLLNTLPIEPAERALLADMIAASETAQTMANGIIADPAQMAITRKDDETLSIAGAADKNIEAMYKSILLAKHGGLFLGEESHNSGTANTQGYSWIVDPVDGTTNFSAGAVNGGYPGLLPMSCTSVALEKNGEPYMGVVRNLATGATFFAVKGAGAYVWDGAKLFPLHANKDLPFDQISQKPTISFGRLPRSTVTALKDELIAIVQRRNSGNSTREMGCVAYELCLVACGALCAYVTQASPWDYKAAALIAQESGAALSVQLARTEKNETHDTLIAAHKDISKQLGVVLQRELQRARLGRAEDRQK